VIELVQVGIYGDLAREQAKAYNNR